MSIITGILHFIAVMWTDDTRAFQWLLHSWLAGPFAAALVTCPLAATVAWKALRSRSSRRSR
jgi:hypothetical protein